MAVIVDETTVSNSQIKIDIRTFIDGKPDSEKWKDFFDSSTGQTVIELLAGILTFITYNNVTARRETYLAYSKVRSSMLGVSQNLGYSVFRGQCTYLSLTVNPTSSISLSKYDVIGSVKDKDLVIAEDTILVTGIPITINTIVGDRKTEDLVAKSSDLSIFRFTNLNVSVDIKLLLKTPTETVVPFSNKIIELINDKYVAISNVMGSVDVMYLNTDSSAAYKYSTNDTLTLVWVEYSSITFVDSDVKFNYGSFISDSTGDGIVVSTANIAGESSSSIKINAPLFNETQFVVRARADYMKIFRLLGVIPLIDSPFISTSYRDVSSEVVELTYVKTNETFLDSVENSAILTSLTSYRSMGLQPPTIKDPIKVPMVFDITITTSETVTQISADATVAAIIAPYTKILQGTVDLDQIESDINQNSYVKISRVVAQSNSFVFPSWVGNTAYLEGAHVQPITPNGRYYVVSVAGTSGSSEPTWSVNNGDLVVDAGITWKCVDPTNSSVRIHTLAWDEYASITTNVVLI